VGESVDICGQCAVDTTQSFCEHERSQYVEHASDDEDDESGGNGNAATDPDSDSDDSHITYL